MNRPKAVDLDQIRSLATKILQACGHTRILNVGCGDGSLVQALLEQGCDAHGIDTDRKLFGHGANSSPSRFSLGSVSKLSFPANSFDGLVVTHGLENLTETEMHGAIGELYRVAQRHLLLQVGTRSGPGAGTGSVIRDRSWWERIFFSHGFRKALSAGTFQAFASFESEPEEILIVLEKIPRSALERFPLESLARNRDLHMDMMRETGRRSEAHIARYSLACGFVRENDRVLDAACGLGYGAATLQSNTRAASVHGIDASRPAITYARANYSGVSGHLQFQHLSLPKLTDWPDNSLDLVVSFETLEHLKEPKSFLTEVNRVLSPGGRFICSVPNLWVDASGKDPNPHHFHTFDFTQIRDLVSARLLIEEIYSQTAGGGMVLRTSPRQITRVEEPHLLPGAKPPEIPAEWWLVVAMKNPWQKRQPRYHERMFPEGGANPPNYLSFERDYRNPWLIRSMISMGSRARGDLLLSRIARDTLANAPRNSADCGAALCVLLYRSLGRATPIGKNITQLLTRAESYAKLTGGDNPHVKRWRISINFALGLYYTKSGDPVRAIARFEQCAAAECREFSHLLATKTIRAAHLAAILHLSHGREADALRLWRHGLNTAYQVFSDSLLSAVGNLEAPPVFALRELTQALDFAQQCAAAINLRQRAEGQRPLFSRLLAESLTDEIARVSESYQQLSDWNAELVKGRDWQVTQNENLSAKLKEAARLANEQRAWNTTLTEGKKWLEKQLQAIKPQHAEMMDRLAKLQAWTRTVTEAKDWQEKQNAGLAEALRSTQHKVAELEAQAKALREANEKLAARHSEPANTAKTGAQPQ